MADLDRDPPIVVKHEGSKPIALPAEKYLALYVRALINAPILDGQAMTTYLTDRGTHDLHESITTPKRRGLRRAPRGCALRTLAPA